jgi:hypothetical protein
VLGAVAGRLTHGGGDSAGDEQAAEARRVLAQQRKLAAIAARQAAKIEARERVQQERLARLQQRRQERALKAEAAAVARQRAEDEGAAAFGHYLSVREHVRRMASFESAATLPLSQREQETLAAVRHIWDATPDVIGSLRHHTGPIMGLDASHEAPTADERKLFFLDLGRLVKIGRPSLLVAEPALLGGFGHASHGPDGVRLYNDETLAFYEVLLALECGAILAELSPKNGRRPIVWEIGGGWGGFAYQTKTLYPDLTYVITAPPELLLFSAVYLMTAFPTARCRFYDERPGDAFWRNLEDVDFAFATDAALDHVVPEAVNLALDIRALEQMSVERVQRYVRSAFDLGARYLYSLGPADDSPALTAVVPEIRRLFWCHELPVPQYDGMPVLGGLRRPGPPDGVPRLHRLGWRRLRP